MAREYIELGSTPSDEQCAQIGSENYRQRAIVECGAYVDQLYRTFGQHANTSFGTKWFPHDFGSYAEVVVYYDDTDLDSIKFAFTVESELPTRWDKPARAIVSATQWR